MYTMGELTYVEVGRRIDTPTGIVKQFNGIYLQREVEKALQAKGSMIELRRTDSGIMRKADPTKRY